ncbi:hypothetical protein OG21DRAFT_1009085 [Imleria badia]|nr:hypothetical protein OG21DRAFT_1009085 [Imleria badia]
MYPCTTYSRSKTLFSTPLVTVNARQNVSYIQRTRPRCTLVRTDRIVSLGILGVIDHPATAIRSPDLATMPSGIPFEVTPVISGALSAFQVQRGTLTPAAFRRPSTLFSLPKPSILNMPGWDDYVACYALCCPPPDFPRYPQRPTGRRFCVYIVSTPSSSDAQISAKSASKWRIMPSLANASTITYTPGINSR